MSMNRGIYIAPIIHTPTMGLLYFFNLINKPFFVFFEPFSWQNMRFLQSGKYVANIHVVTKKNHIFFKKKYQNRLFCISLQVKSRFVVNYTRKAIKAVYNWKQIIYI